MRIAAAAPFVLLGVLALAAPTRAEPRQLLWGDTHVHSRYSFDAYLNLNASADPATAYRFAKGLPVVHPYHRARVQLRAPLDFLVVADHAESLGVVATIVDEGIPREGLGPLERLRAWATERQLRRVVAKDEGMAAFISFLPDRYEVEAAAAAGRSLAVPNGLAISRTVWRQMVETADAHNEPGVFSALIGWEWSSLPAGANLHRVVMTSADAAVAAQFQPFSSVDSMYPEDLWAWLEETRARTGAEFVAIPHNSNISRGYMFAESTLRGEPMSPAYARRRLAWEPVVEVTQLKGDSEAHPTLSPDDPFADFEEYPHYIHQDAPPYRAEPGDYVRTALLRGLAIGAKVGFNPYRFGLIGSTDAHTGLASAEEPNFWGKFGRDSVPETKDASWRAAACPWAASSGPAAVRHRASGCAPRWSPAAHTWTASRS